MSALEFAIERNPNPLSDAEREEILANPGFGKHFTDHMVRIDWTADKGWHGAKLQAYGSIEMQPSSSVLHYGQSIFEGLNAYRMPDGSIVTFRPEQNARRFQRSADRIAMPQLPEGPSSRQSACWLKPMQHGCRQLVAKNPCTCVRSCSPPRAPWVCTRRTLTPSCSSLHLPARTSPVVLTR